MNPMYLRFNELIKSLFGITVLIIVFASCVPMKKQIYFQAYQDSTKSEYINTKIYDHKLQAGNNLYARVYSLDEKSYEFFNLGYNNQSSNVYYDAGVYLNSYYIDNDGYVDLPFIGKIYVLGLTVDEAKEKFQAEIDKYLNKTTVIVKLVNFNVTVVGEVQNPGQYKIYQDKINIFEVISLAGDLTTYAKREDLVLVRKNGNKSNIFHIDLLHDNILESEYYYVMPDDIVYVTPLKGKNFAFTAFPYTLVISTISLGLALFAIFK
jgi:polysaccharide export outer membrane protein